MDFLGNSHYQRAVINPAHRKKKWGLMKKTLGLVHASCDLREWQTVKLTSFYSEASIFIDYHL